MDRRPLVERLLDQAKRLAEDWSIVAPGRTMQLLSEAARRLDELGDRPRFEVSMETRLWASRWPVAMPTIQQWADRHPEVRLVQVRSSHPVDGLEITLHFHRRQKLSILSRHYLEAEIAADIIGHELDSALLQLVLNRE